MSRLISLPDELLLLVIKETCPEGIQDLVLCCKKLYNKSDKILEEHRMYKKKYTEVVWPPVPPCPKVKYLALPCYREYTCCLSDVLLNPHLTPNVKRIRFIPGWAYVPENPARPFPHLDIETSDRVWQDFFDISDCLFIPHDEMDHWRQKLDTADPEVVFALLLVRLPNVESIIADCEEGAWNVLTVVKHILKAHKMPEQDTETPAPLSKLKCVTRLSLDWEARNIGLFEAFCMLPSMSTILHNGPGEGFNHWPSPTSISEVTRVAFLDSSWGLEDYQPEAIVRVLSHLKKLERFEYKDYND